MNYEEYDEIDAERWTVLASMADSPAHYQEAKQKRFETKSLRLGRAVHCALLEPDLFKTRWVTYTGKKRDKRIKEYQEFLERNRGAEILNAAEMSHVIAVAASVRRHPVARVWMEGAHEVSVTWIDEHTGLRCKARCDTVTLPKLVELKNTRSGDPRRFGYQAAALRYHCGLAFHLDGLLANGYELDQEPLIICVEGPPVFDVAVFDLPAEAIAAGRAEYQRLLVRVAECQASGRWPGRAPSDIVRLTLPDYAYADNSVDAWGLDTAGLEE